MSQSDQSSTVETVEQPEAQGIDRRTIIRTAGVLGVGLVGAGTIAACGDNDEPAAPSGGGGKAAAIKVADIPVGGGKVFEATKVVVTQPTAGEFKAFTAVCTHQGCTVRSVEAGTINCACHGSKYDMATGKVVGGPAPAPLAAKTATVSGDSITVS